MYSVGRALQHHTWICLTRYLTVVRHKQVDGRCVRYVTIIQMYITALTNVCDRTNSLNTVSTCRGQFYRFSMLLNGLITRKQTEKELPYATQWIRV